MVVENFLLLKETGVGASSTAYLNLENDKSVYNVRAFNTLTIINTSTNTDLTLLKDGKAIFFLTKNNGVFQVEAKDMLRFSSIGFTNATLNALTDEIKLTLGVTGTEDLKLNLEA